MNQLLPKLAAAFPDLRFTAGQYFAWSPESREVIYKGDAAGQTAVWSLLHETSHALLKHTNYQGDFQLLRMERDAWQRAQSLAADLGLPAIDEDHIQDCLDTYRDWLYKRSICPTCNAKCLQQDDLSQYRCFNCHATWSVGTDRFRRIYRRSTPLSDASRLIIQ